MKTVCEILTTDLEGGPARIPFWQFKELYTYLAEIDGEIAKEHVDTVIEHLSYDVWVVVTQYRAFYSQTKWNVLRKIH